MEPYKKHIHTILLILIFLTTVVTAQMIYKKLNQIELITIQKSNEAHAAVSSEMSHFFTRFHEEKEKANTLFLDESYVIDYDAMYEETVPVRFRAVPKQFDPTTEVHVQSIDGKFKAVDLRYTASSLECVFYMPITESKLVPMVTMKNGNLFTNEVFQEIFLDIDLNVNVYGEVILHKKDGQLTISGSIPFSFHPIYKNEGETSTLFRYPKSIALKVYKNKKLHREQALEFDYKPEEIGSVSEISFRPRISELQIQMTPQDTIDIEFELLDNLGIRYVESLNENMIITP